MTDIVTLFDNTQATNLSEENTLTKPIIKNPLEVSMNDGDYALYNYNDNKHRMYHEFVEFVATEEVRLVNNGLVSRIEG